MKNTHKPFGIIALTVVIGFSMAACPTDNPSGGGDIPVQKTIVFAMESFQDVYSGTLYLGVFKRGWVPTTYTNFDDAIAAAVAGSERVNQIATSNTFRAPLYDLKTDLPWTGSGTYDIYVVFMTSPSTYPTYYRKQDVNISSSSASTSISITDNDKFTPTGGGGGDSEYPSIGGGTNNP